MGNADRYSVNECVGLSGLEALSSDWYRLLEDVAAPHFNQYPDWYHAYFHAVDGSEERLRFVIVRDRARLVAVLPLIFEKSRGLVRKAKLAVDAGIYTTDLVISDRHSKSSVWEAIQKSAHKDRRSGSGWDVFSTSAAVLEDSAIAMTMRKVDSAFESEAKSYCMILDIGPYEEIYAGLKSKFRNNLKRSRRRLQELGDVSYEWCDSKEPIVSAFEEFVRLESAGWKGNSSKQKAGYPGPAAIALQSWKLEFYRRVLHGFARLDALEMLLLRQGSKVIGAQFSIRLKHTNYLLKTTFDERIKGIAIGHLMLAELITRLAERGDVKEINLLTDYDWHKPWGPRLVPYTTFVAYNNTTLGLLGRLRKQLRS